jgi:hypothetical protein
MTRFLDTRFSTNKQGSYWTALFLLLFSPATLVTANLALPHTLERETPDLFAHRFADFEFKYHAEVQDPDVFMATKSGDCDDFATFAATALGNSGYSTRLFAVRMKGETHVVCYVPAARGYLDYNNRGRANPWVASDGSLRDIAGKVARSFNRDWVSAYEFSFRDKRKWLVDQVVVNRSDEKTMLAGAPVQEAAGNPNQQKLVSTR